MPLSEKEILSDPEFQGLPEEEKAGVLLEVRKRAVPQSTSTAPATGVAPEPGLFGAAPATQAPLNTPGGIFTSKVDATLGPLFDAIGLGPKSWGGAQFRQQMGESSALDNLTAGLAMAPMPA